MPFFIEKSSSAMIFPYTRLNVVDNSGAKLAMCIGIKGQKKVGYPGSIITVSIKQMQTSAAMKQAMVSQDATSSTTSGLKSPSSAGKTPTHSTILSNTAIASYFKVKKGEVHKALIVRTKRDRPRPDGRRIRFDDNAIILLNPDFTPMASRVYGPIADEVRTKGDWAKVLALASKVL
jgi:ribosomal protein L14